MTHEAFQKYLLKKWILNAVKLRRYCPYEFWLNKFNTAEDQFFPSLFIGATAGNISVRTNLNAASSSIFNYEKITWKFVVKLDLSLRPNLVFYYIPLTAGRKLNVLDVFWTLFVRFINFLCPKGWFQSQSVCFVSLSVMLSER